MLQAASILASCCVLALRPPPRLLGACMLAGRPTLSLQPRALGACMAAGRQKKAVASNRLARRNYEILDEFEAGIALVGTEVKSCRAGRCTLRDGYCRIQDGECWLHNVNIARHSTAGSYFQHEETRPRRLLLHKREIRKLEQSVAQQGLTIVPLSAYFNDKSCLKVAIGLARGKKLQDKRQDLKRKDAEREVSRQIKAMR